MNLTPQQKKLLNWALVVAGVVVIVLNIISRCTGVENMEQEGAEEEYISINHLISNDMSDSESTKKLDNYVEKFLKRWEIKGEASP